MLVEIAKTRIEKIQNNQQSSKQFSELNQRKEANQLCCLINNWFNRK